MPYKGKRALITGASQGIGRRLAVHLARRGAEVWLAARNTDGLAETLRMVEDAGGVGHASPCDLRDVNAIQAFAERADPIDLLIHNAADVTSKPFTETS